MLKRNKTDLIGYIFSESVGVKTKSRYFEKGTILAYIFKIEKIK